MNSLQDFFTHISHSEVQTLLNRNPEVSPIKSLVGIQLQQNYQMLVILGLLQTDTWYVANPSL